MKSNVFIIFFALSFWSSGVALIRLFSNSHVLENDLALASIFLLTVPIVYYSVVGMRKIAARAHQVIARALTMLVACVLALHGLALSAYPQLYGFSPTAALTAAAWLLWFGAIALWFTIAHRE